MALEPPRQDTFDDRFPELLALAYRVAYRILGDRDEASDIAAETLARAYAAWPKLADAPYLEAWVVRVATNLALKAVRPRGGSLASSLGIGGSRAHARHDRDVTDSLVLAGALRKLPKRQREAVVLCWLEGFTEVEVAGLLGLSPNTVKTHVQRGMAALRADLDERDYQPCSL